MAPLQLPTVRLAILADRHPATGQSDRLAGVLAFTDDRDERYYQPVDEAPGQPPRGACQLTLDLGVLTDPQPSSAGLTWRTWTLTSIPADLRHLPIPAAVAALARRLAERSP
jgi:hypothetical protein